MMMIQDDTSVQGGDDEETDYHLKHDDILLMFVELDDLTCDVYKCCDHDLI